MIELFNGFGKLVPVLWNAGCFLAGAVAGGYITRRFKMGDTRREKREALETGLDKLRRKVRGGHSHQSTELHKPTLAALDDLLAEARPHLDRKLRKKLEALRAEFAALGDEDLQPRLGGTTKEEKHDEMFRGIDRMAKLLEAMLDVV